MVTVIGNHCDIYLVVGQYGLKILISQVNTIYGNQANMINANMFSKSNAIIAIQVSNFNGSTSESVLYYDMQKE